MIRHETDPARLPVHPAQRPFGPYGDARPPPAASDGHRSRTEIPAGRVPRDPLTDCALDHLDHLRMLLRAASIRLRTRVHRSVGDSSRRFR